MNRRCVLFVACSSLVFVGTLRAADVILNEYNSVSSSRYLDDDDYSGSDKGDPFFVRTDIPDGRIQGNGGNWFELVVTDDHLDMRNWQLRWAEQGTNTGTRNIWTGTGTVDQGTISLSGADIWSDLRSGSIITFSELETIQVDTTPQGTEKNFTNLNDVDGTFEQTYSLATDTSYDPAGGDWWIHVSTLDELDSAIPLATTVTNVADDNPGNFSVGNDDWQLTILSATGAVEYGPVGEGIGPLGGVNSRDVGKLEENPTKLIIPDSAYNDGTSSTIGAPNSWTSGTVTQDFAALRSIDLEPGTTELQAGDADQDLDFDQVDIVKVQIAAKYLTGQAATWGEGDWNGAPGGSVGNPPTGDGAFNQLDIVAAQQAGLYLQGPYAAVAAGGTTGDGQTSLVYDAGTGELSVDAPAGTNLTSINIDSASGIFTGDPAQNLGGSFDNDADNNVFKATFGSSFGSLSFGNVAQAGLDEQFLLEDLTAVGSLEGGGALGDVDLVYVPEPSAMALIAVGLSALLPVVSRRRRLP